MSMSPTILLAFFTLFVTIGIAESICCNQIRFEVKRKKLAYETLCSVGSKLSANCCEEIMQEVRKYQLAYGALCTATCINSQALGMESGKISDAAITASSSYSVHYLPRYSRLRKNLGRGCSWLYKKGSGPKTSWLQVDFGKRYNVTAVSTQGSCTYDEWAKTYIISYSDDAVNWTYYKEANAKKIFNGNSDRNTVVTNSLQPPIVARYVRISPQSIHGWGAMRIEYYGCRLEP